MIRTRVYQYLAAGASIGVLPLLTSADTQKPLGGGATGGNPFTEDFGKFAEDLLETWHVPGVSIGVVDGDETFTKGYGIATYPDTPVTPETLFYGGSTTKAFTAATLSIIIDSGNYTSLAYPSEAVAWTTPITEILRDDFVLQDDWATTHLTIEDALSHRTGMPRHDMAWPETLNGKPATVSDIVRGLRYLPLNEPPRTTYQYCNFMYLVASHVAETLTGRWLGDLIADWIWSPLDMKSSYFSRDDALAAPEHLARGYYWDEASGTFGAVPHMSLNSVSGAGSVISNVVDYTKWIRALLRETGPIPKAGHAAFRKPRIFTSANPGPFDTPGAYAFGWLTTSYKGHRLWTHSGGMDAYGAEVYFFPDFDYGVVTFANTAVTSNYIGEILVWKLVDDRLGIPEDERHDWAGENEKRLKKTNDTLNHAVDISYPDRPQPGLPRSLPIEAYAGTYHHPGYLNLTLELVDTETSVKPQFPLVAKRTECKWPTVWEFEHVTGEFWVSHIDLITAPGMAIRDFAPVEFKIGADGKVEAVSIEIRGDFEGKMEGKFLFEKVG